MRWFALFAVIAVVLGAFTGLLARLLAGPAPQPSNPLYSVIAFGYLVLILAAAFGAMIWWDWRVGR